MLDKNIFEVDPEKISDTKVVLTLFGGKPVYGTGSFADLVPKLLPIEPAWSPVTSYGGFYTSS